MPNSAAELEAYGKAMAEFVKEMANNNAATEENRPRIRGQKRSATASGNGKYESNSANPDESAQSRELNARRLPISQLLSPNMVNPNGQTTQNSVLKTSPKLLNDEFLLDLNSLNHTAQLDEIRRLDRDQRDRRTSDARCVEIADFYAK
jgi:hypothetical protein